MEVESLIEEMQEVRLKYPAMEIQDILRVFNIKTMQELCDSIKMLTNALRK